MARQTQIRADMRDEEIRSPIRSEPRDEVRLKPGEFRRSDGTIYSLARRAAQADEYTIPENLKDPHMSYQWVAITVYNRPNSRQITDMEANGWEPCRPDEFREYFKLYANGNCIEWGGQRLYKRHKEATDYIRYLEQQTAAQQLGKHIQRVDSNDAGRMMPDGFEMNRPMISRGRPEAPPADLKPRYRAQVEPAGDE